MYDTHRFEYEIRPSHPRHSSATLSLSKTKGSNPHGARAMRLIREKGLSV